jgi:inhibitor of KinA
VTAFPSFRPVADRAVLVAFADTPGPEAEAAVQALDRALAAAPCPGVLESVPAYVTLAVIFDPVETDHAAVTAHLRGLLAHRPPAPTPADHDIAVCYDPPHAPDLAEVAARTGLSPEGVIAAHLAGAYHVVMYGFAPGYAYLAGLPPALRLDRKPAAIRGVPAGSVIIAGAQALVTTLTMPTGWWIIGRSPTRILTGDTARPFRFAVGDRIRFRRVPAGALDG